MDRAPVPQEFYDAKTKYPNLASVYTEDIKMLTQERDNYKRLCEKVMDKFKLALDKYDKDSEQGIVLRQLWSELIIDDRPITEESRNAVYNALVESGVIKIDESVPRDI